ncbi:heme-binding domain-containing protein [Terrimonas alba]|uniref:heme-binding domain-containing protein n=1 Tax=Terrimonas alba TaxID=3349636 RepID=UPI0035F34CD8
MLKKIFLFLLVILIIIQFIHPEKNKATGPQANYIGNAHPVPDDVKIILAKACNDCHSNNTEYPWYSAIQPVDWWMNGHVNDGKKHLNLDDYTKRSLRYQYHKLEEIEEQIKEGEMPLQSYTWVHKDAILTAAEKEKLISWTNALRDSMEAKYPIDSLIRKK